MRYDLGLMDMYPIESCGSCVENNPFVRITFKTKVDPVRMEDALYRAMRFHPMFGTQLRYDGTYYYETNNRPVKLIHADEDNRPSVFGSTTNGYPWQLCWYDRVVIFEWNHSVADGKSMFGFMKTLLSIYCGMKYPEVPRKIMLGPGLEPFADYSEKGENFHVAPNGFPIRELPPKYKDFRTDLHVLEADTKEILAVSKACGSSPSAVLSILMSQAIRKHLPAKARNKNVSCNIVMDLRKPLNYETMHNCVDFKRLTYVERHESMSFAEVAREYKEELDLARTRKNVIRILSDRVKLFENLHLIHSRKFTNLGFKLTGGYLKYHDSNCVLTYIGKTEFPPEVNEQIADFDVRSWNDYSAFVAVALDFNGRFKINLSDNFLEKGIVEDFMLLCEKQGIHFTETETRVYLQSRFVEEGSTVTAKVKEPAKVSKRAPREIPVPLAERVGSPVYFL